MNNAVQLAFGLNAIAGAVQQLAGLPPNLQQLHVELQLASVAAAGLSQLPPPDPDAVSVVDDEEIGQSPPPPPPPPPPALNPPQTTPSASASNASHQQLLQTLLTQAGLSSQRVAAGSLRFHSSARVLYYVFRC